MASRVNNELLSLKFMIGSFLERSPKKVVTYDHNIAVGSKVFNAIVFENKSVANRGTVIIINGFSVWGHRDPRMMNVGKHFANIGFRVIAPSFYYLNELVIDPVVVEDIGSVIKAVSSDKELCPEGKVSVFAPSYTAGMTLIACSRHEVNHLVKAICSIGTYANIETSIEFILKKQDIDNYGRMVLMKNFLHFEINEPEILEAINIAIQDNGLKRPKPLLPAHLSQMSESNRQLFHKLDKDAHYRYEVLKKAFRSYGRSEQILAELNVVDHIKSINASVCLIHGHKDNVIPPSESRQLHLLLNKLPSASKLCITPLLSHGDVQIGPRIIANVIELMQGFSFFIRHASAKA